MRALAVDVGGTHVSCGVGDDDKLLDSISLESNSAGTLSDLLKKISQVLRSLLAQHGNNFEGIGFGFCGLVDGSAGKIVSTNHKYSDATKLDLVSWAREEFSLPLILENDSRMALLGERHSGAARNSDDVVMMTLGTGIGTAAIMGGRIVRGKHFQAGCLGGHFTVAPGGRLCSCGARGCFEAESSTFALPQVCKDWPGFHGSSLANQTKLDFLTLFRCADEGDSIAKKIRTKCIEIWAACALSLVHAYDPDRLILGGGIMNSSYPILKAIEEHVHSYAWTPWGKVEVRAAELGSNAALFGAVPLFQEQR